MMGFLFHSIVFNMIFVHKLMFVLLSILTSFRAYTLANCYEFVINTFVINSVRFSSMTELGIHQLSTGSIMRRYIIIIHVACCLFPAASMESMYISFSLDECTVDLLRDESSLPCGKICYTI